MQVTEAEFLSALDPLLDGPFPTRIAAAISGGPDSMALALCTQRWCKAHSVNLFAFIVDHQLRSESTAEAAAVQTHLSQLGIDATVLTWDHPPLVTAIERTARAARYDLMVEACHAKNIRYLLLAHQQNDQAETVLMRLAKGSGIDGLAGIAPVSNRQGICLLRPLLAFPKDRLIATCQAFDMPFVTDPTNLSQDLARGRLRRVADLLAAEGLTLDRLSDLADRAREGKEALALATHNFLTRATSCDLSGAWSCRQAAFKKLPQAIRIRVLCNLLNQLHPRPYPAKRAALLPIVAKLCALDEAVLSLQGCRLSIKGEVLSFMREATAIEASPLTQGQTILWDNRWQVTLHQPIPDLEIRPLGLERHDLIKGLSPNLTTLIPEGRKRASLPALWRGDTIQIIPDFSDSSTLSPATASLIRTEWQN